jgi:anti-sigma regulatory factor (Ser/Thr protein kinase)
MPERATITFTIIHDVNALNRTRNSILAFLKSNAIDEDAISEIELATYEVLANIIEHSPAAERGNKIICECALLQNRIEVRIEHRGERFDITEGASPDLREHFARGKSRGLGIYIIRTLMDAVEYAYAGNRNVIRLVKEL